MPIVKLIQAAEKTALFLTFMVAATCAPSPGRYDLVPLIFPNK
jgi:hypothetical protein